MKHTLFNQSKCSGADSQLQKQPMRLSHGSANIASIVSSISHSISNPNPHLHDVNASALRRSASPSLILWLFGVCCRPATTRTPTTPCCTCLPWWLPGKGLHVAAELLPFPERSAPEVSADGKYRLMGVMPGEVLRRLRASESVWEMGGESPGKGGVGSFTRWWKRYFVGKTKEMGSGNGS